MSQRQEARGGKGNRNSQIRYSQIRNSQIHRFTILLRRTVRCLRTTVEMERLRI